MKSNTLHPVSMPETIQPIVGTHNSMTFLRPAHWYGWLMIPFARCQRKSIEQQFLSGARCFDLRVRFRKESANPVFAHGLMTLKGDLYATLLRLSTLSTIHHDKIRVRLILEDPNAQRHNEIYFRTLCENVQEAYPLLTYFGGNRKGDWKQICDFPCKPRLVQCVGSMADDARWYEKIIPWFYARRCNKRNKPQDDITIYDFL